MLILTRKIGESIMIGDEIKVNILSVRGGQVKIGFQAPESVAVHREEIYFRIQEERIQEGRLQQGKQAAPSFHP